MPKKIVAIVQARVASTRLPAKVLLDLGGGTALERCLARVRRMTPLDDVIVATSTKVEDDIIVALARRLGFAATRGSEQDVLSRYDDAAKSVKADVVVRCTSDCPLFDPEVGSSVVRAFVEAKEPLDYASNTLTRKYPRGLDTEVFSAEALARAHEEAVGGEREHVTMTMYRHPETYRCVSVPATFDDDLSFHRWTLDTIDDYRFLFAVFDALGDRAKTAPMREIADFLKTRPDLVAINQSVAQKTV